MIKQVLISITLSSYLLGDMITQKQIDPNKNVIQIASSKSKKELTNFSKRFKDLDQDIHIRDYKNRYYILYTVNIEDKILKQTLTKIRQKSPSAFITKELSIYLNSLKISQKNKTPLTNISSNPNIQKKIVNKDINYLDPIKLQDIENLYQKAIYAYNQKDYKDAYKYFAKFASKNPLDKRGNFFYARSAFESSYYHEALAIYEKILLQDSNNARVKLEIGQCYFRLKKYKDAKKSFYEVLQEKLPTNVKQNVIAMLRAIETKETKNFTQAMVMVGYTYDSNVNNSADAGDYTIYLPSLNSSINMNNNGEKTSDSSLQAIVSLNHKYKLDEAQSIDSKVTAFTQKYNKEHEKDIDVLSLELALSRYTQDTKLSLGLGYNHIFLDSHSYMEIPSLNINYNKKLSSTLNYQGYLKFLDKNYKQKENKDRDSNAYELYNSLGLSTKEYGVNTFSLTLGKEERQRGIRTDVNKDYYTFNITNNYSLTKALLLKSSMEYKIISYKDRDINFLTKREDKQTTLSLGLMKSLDQSTTIGTNLQWIDNNSNHEPFSYDKHVVKGFIYYGF